MGRVFDNLEYVTECGRRLAQLVDVEEELRWIVSSIALLEADPTATAMHSDADRRKNLALWWCCVVRYSRCFGEGKRSRIEKLVDSLRADELEMHEFLRGLRHGYMAHAGAEFEDYSCGVVALVDALGPRVAGVWTATSAYHLPRSEELERVQSLCIRLVELLEERIVAKRTKFRSEISALSGSQLQTLQRLTPKTYGRGTHELRGRQEFDPVIPEHRAGE